MTTLKVDESWRQLHAGLGAAQPWLADLRRSAFSQFIEQGLPSTRQEEWRFTELRPLAAMVLKPAAPAKAVIDPAAISSVPETLAPHRVVFVDGVFDAALSCLGQLPAGVRVTPLAKQLAADEGGWPARLAKEVGQSKETFMLLNRAFLNDGAVIEVAAAVEAAAPLHLVSITTAQDDATMVNLRHFIRAERGSSITVIESHVTFGGGQSFSNTVTEIDAAADARVHHYLIQDEHDGARAVRTMNIVQHGGSRIDAHALMTGGAMVRNNVTVTLEGSGANSLLNGLYLPWGEQHTDYHLRVVHAAPGCFSRQFGRGILGGKGSAVFTGRVVVRPGAQKTDARQTNRALLLSDEAAVNGQPQLEIHADDVKCTHGMTTGRLDEESLFYLRSRGIAEFEARRLLVMAFAHEPLALIHEPSIRTLFERLLDEQLLRRLL